jgi:hypothetical protein
MTFLAAGATAAPPDRALQAVGRSGLKISAERTVVPQPEEPATVLSDQAAGGEVATFEVDVATG